METQSIPWREKVQLIVRFLRGSIHYLKMFMDFRVIVEAVHDI